MARPGYFKKTFTIDRKQYTAYGHTHDEAVAKAAIKKAEIEGKIKTQKTARNNITVEKWSKEWLEKHKKGTTGEAWYKSIEGIVNNYIISSPIGGMMIKDIRYADLDALLNSYTHLSVSHGRKILQIIRQIFGAAEKNNLIDRNPAQWLELPKTYQDKIPRRAISDEERALTIKTAEKYPDEGLFFLIMLYCGCRPQEVARLLYGDYDKKTRTLHVQRARKASGETGKTKSESGVRDIPVPDVLADKLDVLKKKKADLICTSAQGKPLTKTSQKRLWHRFRRHMDIENGAELFRNHVVKTTLADDLEPYCYRHTYATDLRDAGVPITVAAKLMGDSSIAVVADIYTHQTQAAVEDARSKINEKINKWGTKRGTDTEDVEK